MPSSTVISKSSYITGFRCRYATYLNVLNRNLAKSTVNELVCINGHKFNEVAVNFMKATYQVIYSTSKENMVQQTENAINRGHKIIADASFMIDGMFCSADILVINDDESFSIYEVKSETEIKEINKFDLAFQYHILTSLGYKVKSAFLMYANGEYSFNKGETIDYSKIFILEDFTEDCIKIIPTVKEDISIISEALKTKNPPEHEFSSSCNAPYKCPFMCHCIKEARLPEKTNIFNISGPHFNTTKLKWYNSGIKTYEDLLQNVKVKYKKNGEPTDASWKYVQQAETYLAQEDAPVEYEKLGKFLEQIVYPIASFDYEGFETAIPLYYGLKPHQQVVFQFSYDYIEKEGAEIVHYDFLANPEEDPRLAVCKALAKLPKANTILVWNKTYEASRNKEMANLEGLEDYTKLLLEMVNNFVDIMVPFRERVITPWKANGSYSLKPITEALIPNLQYHDLKVYNGIIAAERYLELPYMEDSERKKCIQTMKMYNNQDTFGPLKILEKMFRIFKNDENFVLFTEKTQKDMTKNILHIGDTVACNKGIGSITKISDAYLHIMLMDSGEEIRRIGKKVVLVQKYVNGKSRNITLSKELDYNDLVVCNKGIGKVYGFTRCFVRIKLLNGNEVLRKRFNILKIQDFVD